MLYLRYGILLLKDSFFAAACYEPVVNLIWFYHMPARGWFAL